MVEVYVEEAKLIGPGSKDICGAAVLIWNKSAKGVLSPNGKKPSLILVGLSHYPTLSS